MHDTLSNYCRFLVEAPVAHAEAVLEVLQDWAAHPKGEFAELAASLLNGYLQLEAHGLKWEEGVLVPLDATFTLTDAIARVRDRAIAILVRCARREDPGVQHEAARALEDWPLGYDKLNTELLERWAPQLEKESQALTEGFGKLGSTTPHLPVRAAIEYQGWRLWANPEEGFAQRIGGQLLRSVPVGTPYALWKALHADTLPITTVVPEETMSANDRRAHFLAATNPDAEQITQRAKTLFDELGPLYPDASAWQDLYTSVLRALPKQALQPQAHSYLAEFVGRHRDAAWSLVTETLAGGPGEADSAECARGAASERQRSMADDRRGGRARDAPVRCNLACVVGLERAEPCRAGDGHEGARPGGRRRRFINRHKHCSTFPRTLSLRA